MSQELVTVKEAAKLLGTNKEKIARLVKRGVLTSRPSVLDARKRLIPREEIDRILEAEGRPVSVTVHGPARGAERPQPRTAGMYAGPIRVQSDEVEGYLQRNWRDE